MSKITNLSAGLLVREMLESIGCRVFPVVSESGASLPYVCYARTGLMQQSIKGKPAAGGISLDVSCYAEDYESSVALAEEVRDLMDGNQYTYEGESGKLVARSIVLTDASEGWEDDAYAQHLTFSIKIG